MRSKADLIKKQRLYLDKVMEKYDNVTLTDIARHVGVAQTTITRWYNGSPKHALSATTFDKITDAYPIEDVLVKNQITEADIAILYTMKTLIAILLKQKTISPKDLDDAFTHGKELYRLHHLSDAMKIMEDLRTSVTGETLPKQQEALRKLLTLAPVGSA